MVLSDLLCCICFPCRPISVYMYVCNEEKLCCRFNDDDVWYNQETILDNKVLEIDFDHHYILLSDEQVHI